MKAPILGLGAQGFHQICAQPLCNPEIEALNTSCKLVRPSVAIPRPRRKTLTLPTCTTYSDSESCPPNIHLQAIRILGYYPGSPALLSRAYSKKLLYQHKVKGIEAHAALGEDARP